MTVSWLESFAFNSPILFALAKCALSIAFEEPPATPQMARHPLAAHSKGTRSGIGREGLKQSMMNAQSFTISARNLYILQSDSIRFDAQCAKKMVAKRPRDS